MKKILLFASGSGTNVENIIRYFQEKQTAEVVAVFCNNPNAQVVERSENLGIPSFIFKKEDLNSGIVLKKLHQFEPDLIVLAGFLLQFPSAILKEYTTIINIHPALLPKYGGKGMYGMNVHRAILENKEVETGITIHFVNENYDEGAIIFQKSTSVADCLSAEDVAAKIHQLEQAHFPKVIEQLLQKI
ncbi:phosphoribosylglycinamide formyltransferase [Flavobacterium sp. SM2513]|uniref:phosphoribosylglycinamide formyltransferase n=1 Tax=Flavobacterium sp. SM2513 TaxID=3424766 RepID=UPI003D7FD395